MDSIYSSVVLASRERPELLKQAIQTSYDLAKFKDNLEIILRLDKDDVVSLEMINKEFKNFKNLRIFIGERVGYDYVWMLFRDMFQIAKGYIIIPFADDFSMCLPNWDEHFLQYKNESAVLGSRARMAFTKKIIDEDEYIRNFTYNMVSADTNIFYYAYKKNSYIHVKKFFKKMHKTSSYEWNNRWKLENISILDNLKWVEYVR